MSNFIGVSEEDMPALFVYTFVDYDSSPVYKLPVDVSKVKQETLMKFAKGFFSGKLRRYFKSEPIPAESSALVKKVVANTFVDIVLNPKKDVLFMSTTERCPLCKEIYPSLERIAEHVKEIEDIDVVIMDSDKNKA